VAAEVLGAGVHHDVDPELERFLAKNIGYLRVLSEVPAIDRDHGQTLADRTKPGPSFQL
jgi:hypothetical protein